MPEDISRYYTDLTDDDLVTRLALVHRFLLIHSLHGTQHLDTCVIMEKSILRGNKAECVPVKN
jgi:hypothetical protein